MGDAVSHGETIVPRENLDFGMDASMPKYWFRGDAYKTRYLDALQLGFPDGERYFITSVRAFRDAITDPVLRANVRDFMRQEGQHGMAHMQYNDLLRGQGLPIERMLKEFRQHLDHDTRRFSPEFNLAITAGFEHFTAMLAYAFFVKASVVAGADPRMQALLAWHAIEEMEHKSVAFDVMQNVARVGYWKRAGAMLYAFRQMMVRPYVLADALLRADGYSGRQRAWLHIKNFAWIHGPRRGVFGVLMPKVMAYFKPSFHPAQLPSIHNYADWVSAYQRTGDPHVACEALLAAAHP